MQYQDSGDRDSNGSHVRAGIRLIPYVDSGGWSVPDEAISELFARMVGEATLASVFPFAEVCSAQELVDYFRHPANFPVFAVSDHILGAGWINQVRGNSAFAHFWLSKAVWGEPAPAIAQAFVAYWFSWRRPDSSPIFDVLIGSTRDTNRRAVKFLDKIGWEIVGTIPKVYGGDGAVISYKERT